MILVGKETSGEDWNQDEANKLEASRYILSQNKTKLAVVEEQVMYVEKFLHESKRPAYFTEEIDDSGEV